MLKYFIKNLSGFYAGFGRVGVCIHVPKNLKTNPTECHRGIMVKTDIILLPYVRMIESDILDISIMAIYGYPKLAVSYNNIGRTFRIISMALFWMNS